MANGVGAFDVQSGFNVGRQIAGPNALGIMAKNILDQVNNIGGTVVTQKMLSPILSQRAGMEEEEKLKGMARFYQTPEAQSYLSGISQRTQAMLGSMGGGPSAEGTITSSMGLGSYTPQYGFTGATFDPEGGMKFNIGETPQSKARGEIMIAAEKESQTRLEKLRDAIPLLKSYEQRLAELPVSNTAAERVVQGPLKFLETKIQSNPKLAAFESFRTGLRSQVARILGEVGNLSETEQKYAINLLPSQYDIRDVQHQKLNNFYDFIAERVSARMGVPKEQVLQQFGRSANSPTGGSSFQSVPVGFQRE